MDGIGRKPCRVSAQSRSAQGKLLFALFAEYMFIRLNV